MKIREAKKEARRALKGKLSKAVGYGLLYTFFIDGISFILPGIGTLIIAITLIPLYIGITEVCMKLSNNEKVKPMEFFNIGINKFGKSWGIFFLIILRLIPQLLLIMIASFLVTTMVSVELEKILGEDFTEISAAIVLIAICLFSYIAYIKYAFAKYIYINEPNLLIKEILNKSKKLMKGNRIKYLLLQLSFVPWYILVVIILGVAAFGMFGIVLDFFRGDILYTVLWILGVTVLGVILLIYLSCFKPYRIISSMKFYEMIEKSETKEETNENRE